MHLQPMIQPQDAEVHARASCFAAVLVQVEGSIFRPLRDKWI